MLLCLAIIIGAVFLDQLTKYLTVLYLKPMDTLPLIRDVLHLTYVENPGAAFGMLKENRWVFMILSTAGIVAVLLYLFIKKPTSRWERLSLCFIAGGGIGNMIDRTLLGYVVDMIDFRLINFAVFNVADSFVCVGAGLLMLCLILSMIKEWKEEKAQKCAAATAADETEVDEAAPDTTDDCHPETDAEEAWIDLDELLDEAGEVSGDAPQAPLESDTEDSAHE